LTPVWVVPTPHKKQGNPPVIEIYDEIEALKAREDATILAHYYQDGEIQDLADFTGDSLKLARAATTG
jgi:quinolinate synthase